MVESISPKTQTTYDLPEVCSKYLGKQVLVPENKKDTVEISKPQENTQKQDNNSAQENKKKGKSKNFIIAASALGLAGLVTIVGAFTNAHGWNKKVQRILKKNLKNGEEVFNFTKLKDTIKAGSKDKRVIAASNVMNNSANFKDCYILPILEKIPGLRQFANGTSKVYKNTGVKMTQKAYKHAQSLYDNFDRQAAKALEVIKDDKVKQQISELIEKRNAIIQENFTPECVQKITNGKEAGRITVIEKIMDDVGDGKGICITVRDKFNKLIRRGVESKGKDLKGFSNFIAEDLVKNQKENFIAPLAEAKKKVNRLDKQIIELIEKSGNEEYILKESKNLAKARSNAANSLNKAIRMEGNDLFDKMRDVKIGSAPTDILGMVSTAGLMGVYLAQAKDKDQKVEVALTTGVPLGLGMLATTFATMKMYAGMKSLAFGAVATFISNSIGKMINNEYKKKNHVEAKEADIPTLNKMAQDINKKIKAYKQ